MKLNEKELEALISKIDIKKILTDGQILIEQGTNGASITGFYNDEIPNTEHVEFESGFSPTDNKKSIEGFCGLVYSLKILLDVDPSKHAEYRFNCGLDPNGDESYMKLENLIGKDVIGKLCDNGYSIIKDPDF